MRTILTTAALLGLPVDVCAQGPAAPPRGAFAIGASFGVDVFGVAAEAPGEDGRLLAYSPYRPTLRGLRVGYGRRVRVTGSAAIARAGLLARGTSGAASGFLLVSSDVFHLAVFGASLSVPLLTLRGGPSLRPSLGVRVERWTAPQAPASLVAGAAAGLALEFDLTRSFEAGLIGEFGVTPASPFRAEYLPEGFTRHATWRRSVGVTVSWRP